MLSRFAWGVLAYNLLVIAWGAFVRATGSGAGCGSHWPTCNGDVVPRAESVETVIELTHRLTSGVALILVVILVIATFRARPKGHPMRVAAVASLVLMLTEAAIGAGLVLLEYVAENRSAARAWWVGGHLVNTFLLVGALTVAARQSSPESKRLTWNRSAYWVLAAALGTLAVACTGAITALGDTLFPATSLEQGLADDFAATSHFLVKLRVYHPVSALIVSMVVTGVGVWVGRRVSAARPIAVGLIVLFLLQVAGGFLNLYLLAPTWMQLVHLLMADLVWIALVLMGVEVLREDRVSPV